MRKGKLAQESKQFGLQTILQPCLSAWSVVIIKHMDDLKHNYNCVLSLTTSKAVLRIYVRMLGHLSM